MSDDCSKFESDVKHKFEYLFNNDYEIVHRESSSRNRCLIILKSDNMQVKLFRAQDEVNLLVGRVSAPLIWGDKQDGKKEWFYIREVSRFLKNDLDVSKVIHNESKKQVNHEQQLTELSRMLEGNIPEIENLFSKSNYDRSIIAIADFWTEYNRLFDIEYKKYLES